MTYRALFLAAAVMLASACAKARKHGNMISGTLQGVPGTMVYLNLISDSGETAVDSAKTDEEGKFEIANPAEAPDYYQVRLDQANAVFLILQGDENVIITGNGKDLEHTYSVSGSQDCELIRQLKRYDNFLSDSLFSAFRRTSAKFPSQKDSLMVASRKVYEKKMESYARQFIELYPASLVSLSVTRYLQNLNDENVALMDTLRKSLAARYPGNKYVTKFSNVVDQLKFLTVGSQAPEIALPDTAGKVKKLSSLHGKYVLVNFWASWSIACRQEHARLLALYDKYKAKGFEIFGVSLDTNRDDWTKAIIEDKTPWYQVSELKKTEEGVIKDYHVGAVPFTVLLDKSGKVMDKGISSSELEQVLKERL